MKKETGLDIKKSKKPRRIKKIYIIIYVITIVVATGMFFAAFYMKDYFGGNNRSVNLSDSGLEIADSEKSNTATIVFIGDSITAYGAGDETMAQLKDDSLDTKFEKINIALPNKTSAEMADEVLNRVDKLKDISIDMIFISFGLDDAVLGVDSNNHFQNIKKIVDSLAGINAKMVLNYPIFIPKETTKLDTIIYCQQLEKLASESENVTLGDASIYQTFKDDINLMSSDGIHPNDEGYKKIGELWASMFNSVI